jgi:2-C-methyl-D-erythritol 4-phosphate cytidylyltransferase
MRLSTIIVAAGKGLRFGAKKQFFPLCGKPVVLRTLDIFAGLSHEIILVLPDEDIPRFKKKWLPAYPGLKLVSGGARRYDSVLHGLGVVSPECGFVCIHDGVRPLITEGTVKKCIAGARKYGAAVCARQPSDTVKFSGSGRFAEKTIDRGKVWLVQTPQVFRKDIILKAYAKRGGCAGVTDDSMLAERIGVRPRLVRGEASNIKITEKQDIVFAERILCRAKSRRKE